MKKTSKILAAVMAIVMIVAAIPMSAFAADYTIALGETITVTVPAESYAECKFTPDEDGTYVVYSDSGENDIDPKVNVYDADGNEIAEDDDSDYADTYDFYCVFDAEAGAEYLFEMVEYDGIEAEFDITVSVFGEITHQPTSDEPYVEVTEGADAEYQWYKIDGSFEVTDENAEARNGADSDVFATYDSENGWTGVEYDGNTDYIEYNFFKIELEEGQIIRMTSDCYADEIGIWCECDAVYDYWMDVDENETVDYVVNHSCTYNTYGDYAEVPHLKAEIIDTENVSSEAQPDADEAGTYFCLVTFDGCRFEVSDEFEISESDVIPDSNKISKADINVRTDIAGMSVNEYEDYIEILTEGLQFEDNCGDPAVYVKDSNEDFFEGEFVSGETYTFYVYLAPESGYKLANTVDGTVNGEETESVVGFWMPGGEYGDIKVDFVYLNFEITVTDPCDHICHQGGFLGFFWNIINFFNKLFGLNPFCGCGLAHYYWHTIN